MRRARLLSAIFLLTSALVPSCKKRAAAPVAEEPAPLPAPRLGPVVVEDRTPEEQRPKGVTLDLATLRTQLAGRLGGAGLFERSGPDAGGAPRAAARARAEVVLEEVSAGGQTAARALMRLRVEARPSDLAAPHWNEDTQAGAETIEPADGKGDRSALFNKLVARTLSDLTDTYLGRQKLWEGSPQTLHAVLTVDAGELKLEAIRAVADRKVRSEVPALLQLLDAPDETVRDAALGALVELREPSAVAVLTRKRSMNDRREMRKMLDALGAIGGKEAEEYLSFVADGHEDEEIRKMASTALGRLRRRAGAPSADAEAR